MNKIIYIAFLLFAIACTKENTSIQLPVHENSKAWKMTDLPAQYANTKGDTLLAELNSDISYYATSFNDEDFEVENITQLIAIEDSITYKTIITSHLTNNKRDDNLTIMLNLNQEELILSGKGEPTQALELDQNVSYTDSLVINNTIFTKIYTQTSANNNMQMFVNMQYGLAAFALKKDTFNLVK